jgi:glycosyltransferase involved in cell wall biosynthesis
MDFPPSLRTQVTAIPGYRAVNPEMREDGRDSSDCFRFVYAGRVDRTKGIDVLLEAADLVAERLPEQDFRIDCFGKPSEDIVREAPLHPNVRLAGVVPNEDFLALLPTYNAFVYPSVYDNEGHPGAVIEAMLAGLPVVCTSLPTVLEIVTDGVDGLTVAPGDPRSLAEALARLMSDDLLLGRLAQGARRKSLMFDEDVVIPELLRHMGVGGNG